MQRAGFSKSDWIFTIFVAGLHIFVLLSALLGHSYLTDDSIQYLALAENMQEHGIFSQSFFPPFVADVQRTPGYPAFLWIVGSPTMILVLQHLMVLGTGYFLYRALRTQVSEKSARFTAWLWLLQPYPILFSSLILSESLFLFLVMAGFSLWMEGGKENSRVRAVVGFGLMALSVLVRPVFFWILPVLGLMKLIACLRKGGMRAGARILSEWAIALAVLMPWMARNQAVSGDFTISSMTSMGMLYGRAAGLEANRTQIRPDDQAVFRLGDSLAAVEYGLSNLKAYPEGKQNQENERIIIPATSLTVSHFFSHPWEGIKMQVRSTWQMLKGVGFGWGRKIVGEGPAYGLAILQLLSNLLMFGAFALALLRLRKWSRMEFYAAVIIGLIFLFSAAIWADGRYRIPADMFLMVFVASQIDRFFGKPNVSAVKAAEE